MLQVIMVLKDFTVLNLSISIAVKIMFCLQEGTANYFKGLMLILCYMIVAASFFVHIDPKSIREFLLLLLLTNWRNYLLSRII